MSTYKRKKNQKKTKRTRVSRAKTKSKQEQRKNSKSIKRGGNITDLWGRELPVKGAIPFLDVIRGKSNVCLHGENTF